MIDRIKENLNTLTKEQLIKIIEDYDKAFFYISETCVDVSKMHVPAERAICKIRSYLNDPSCYKFYDKHLGDFINFRLGKITPEQYRDIVLG